MGKKVRCSLDNVEHVEHLEHVTIKMLIKMLKLNIYISYSYI